MSTQFSAETENFPPAEDEERSQVSVNELSMIEPALPLASTKICGEGLPFVAVTGEVENAKPVAVQVTDGTLSILTQSIHPVPAAVEGPDRPAHLAPMLTPRQSAGRMKYAPDPDPPISADLFLQVSVFPISIIFSYAGPHAEPSSL